MASGTRLDVKQAIQAAAEQQPIPVSEKCKADILDFVSRRLEQFLVDSGLTVEVAKAVLNERACDPILVQQSAQDLQVIPLSDNIKMSSLAARNFCKQHCSL